MLKRILLVGWALLFVGGFLIVEFPNAAWNHPVSWILWIISIGLFFATLWLCVLVAIRLIDRLFERLSQSPQEQRKANSETQRRRRLPISIVLVAAVVFVVGLVAFIEHEIKSSPIYQMSLARAQLSSNIAGILGHPVNAGWFVSGQLTESTSGDGHATLTIPLKGPKGRGTLRVQADRHAGSWRFLTLQFVPANGQPAADLLGNQTK